MVNQQLIDYIKSEEAQGYTPKQLYDYLVQQGYNPNEVNEAINSVNQNIATQNKPSPAKAAPGKHDHKFIIITAISFVILISAVFWVFTGPVCGNGELEKGETIETCCLDAGCLGEQICRDNACIEPTCGICQYLENHRCLSYECCDDNSCASTEICQDNNCIELSCDDCQYASNHICNDYVCCNDIDCDDNNTDTDDACLNPSTPSASCSNIFNECETDADCNDNDVSTKDACSGAPKQCSNTKITECISGDIYCPIGCTSQQDNDCVVPDECIEDSDCDDSDNNTFDICMGHPKKCYHEIQDCNLTMKISTGRERLLVNLESVGGYSAEGYKGSAYSVLWSVDRPDMVALSEYKGKLIQLTTYNITGVVELTVKDDSVLYPCEDSVEIEIVESYD